MSEPLEEQKTELALSPSEVEEVRVILRQTRMERANRAIQAALDETRCELQVQNGTIQIKPKE